MFQFYFTLFFKDEFSVYIKTFLKISLYLLINIQEKNYIVPKFIFKFELRFIVVNPKKLYRIKNVKQI